MSSVTSDPAQSATTSRPDTSHFNGLQTAGRDYRNLSPAEHVMSRDVDQAVPLRDGGQLLADVYRPTGQGAFPVLIAASPYPRQIQDLGAPTAIIEAGNSEFFVSRGYVHVIANLRGTGGSTGQWGFFDEQERRDLYDLVEWAAEQPWSSGNIGMIGISYFAIAQVGAAAGRPPHLTAIFPFEVTSDLYEAAYHYGLFSSSFITPWLTMLGVTAPKTDSLWRGHVANAARRVLSEPRVHRKVGSINGESANTVLRLLMKAPYQAHPWDDLWRVTAVDHQIRDEFWDQRTALPMLSQVDIPVYIGCDWDNVPMHLPGTFSTWNALARNPDARMALLPSGATTWPWESMHVEALAWFDHWLKGRDTGILDGPRIRYWLPGAEQWRTCDAWPPTASYHQLGLGADGVLAAQPQDGARELLCLGTGLGRPRRARKTDPPSVLHWQTAPLTADLDVAGDIELRLSATSTAIDTAWIVMLRDIGPDGTITSVTGGWQRASLREVDPDHSRTGAPVIPCRNPQAVPVGKPVEYRIPLVPNARRFAAGHRIQLMITSDDQPKDVPVFLGYRHSPVGTTARNTIHTASRLLLPVLPPAANTPGTADLAVSSMSPANLPQEDRPSQSLPPALLSATDVMGSQSADHTRPGSDQPDLGVAYRKDSTTEAVQIGGYASSHDCRVNCGLRAADRRGRRLSRSRGVQRLGARLTCRLWPARKLLDDYAQFAQTCRDPASGIADACGPRSPGSHRVVWGLTARPPVPLRAFLRFPVCPPGSPPSPAVPGLPSSGVLRFGPFGRYPVPVLRRFPSGFPPGSLP